MAFVYCRFENQVRGRSISEKEPGWAKPRGHENRKSVVDKLRLKGGMLTLVRRTCSGPLVKERKWGHSLKASEKYVIVYLYFRPVPQ